MTRLLELETYGTQERRIFAKIEGDNPTGSTKERFVGYRIKELERSGELEKGTTIVEASSGNTGIALAKVGQELGYRVIICVADSIAEEKKKRIRNYGAELREFDNSEDPNAEINAAIELGKEYFFFNQIETPHNPESYYHTLGKEVVEQLRGTTIDHFVAGVGTGGSLIGLARRLREDHNPQLKIFAAGALVHPTKIEGLHPGHIRGDFRIWKERPYNFEEDYILIPDEEAIKHAIELQRTENLSVGPSSGAVLATALRLNLKGNTLLLFADSGDRYQELYHSF